MKDELVQHTLAWRSPYTEPPDGMPRVLATEILPRSMESVVVARLWYPGCGYCQCWSLYLEQPKRQLSEKAKQSIRRKALIRRAEHKAPLFAAELIARRLAAQPEYYGEEVSA